MAARTPIPGQFLSKNEDGKPWDQSSAEIKRRHFVLDGHKLKLFGRRGKTYKGHINLLAVEALRPSTDATAPPGAFELQVRASSSRSRTCILLPDHSVDDVFMALGNAVPSDATSDALWRIHMGSRPAAAAAGPAHEYRMGKTLGTGTFWMAGQAPLFCSGARPRTWNSTSKVARIPVRKPSRNTAV